MPLPHISTSKRKTGVLEYFTTDDPNIFVRQATVEDEIHLDKLNAMIEELQSLNIEELSIPEDTSDVAIKIIESENIVIRNNQERVLSLPALFAIREVIEG
ncbi:MAG: hypothetical protein Q7U10_08790 [Thermodesulfovibrionia bacterium]|nr:hypothetical protein [Thermodesulfovibrionia bacterium]